MRPLNDTRGDVIERLTDRNNLYILNDGSHTYLKAQAQHSQNPTSAIDLSLCTPGLALRCTWEVLPDTHGSDHYPVLISVPPSSGDTDQGSDPSHWVFSKADWEQFAELCMDKIIDDIFRDQDPLTSFVGHVIDAAQYVSKLNSITPITHVWNRLRKISGKNVCPPKQYLNGKDGASITSPKDIANEHAAAFADNSSSVHYSTKFQTIKAHDERARIDFTSGNTEVYNKPSRLRDLRRSILKAKPRAPGPDGIHNNLLEHLPEDTLMILKEILNNIWISGDFPPQWRAATVIPIPKPNKDRTDPLSYRPIALTSCLCKVLERMINTRFIWYLEKYGILDKSQCGFRKHRSTMIYPEEVSVDAPSIP